MARKPTALEQLVHRVTLLALPERYHDNVHVLRVRGCAAMGLLALGAIAAAAALAWASWALPVLPAMLLALWLAAEAWFYFYQFIPRCVCWGGILAQLHVHQCRELRMCAPPPPTTTPRHLAHCHGSRSHCPPGQVRMERLICTMN